MEIGRTEIFLDKEIKIMMKEESPLRGYEIPRNLGQNIWGSEYMG